MEPTDHPSLGHDTRDASDTVRAVLLGVGLALLTIVVYLPALRYDFVWGDDLYITRNPLVAAPDGLSRMWLSKGLPQYYPLTFTTFWLEWRCWGAHPAPYRLGNILLQAAVAMLLWRVLRRLNIPGAWFAAAIFAVHPLQVDSVVWISERVNVLSGVFFVASIHFFLRHQDDHRWSWYVAALGAFVLALLSKTTVVVLPGVLVVLHWWRRRPWTAGSIARLVPFVVLSGVFAWITITYEKAEVGAQGAEWQAGLLERGAVAGHMVWFYLAKLLWPAGLLWVYPRWSIDAGLALSYLPAAGVALLLIVSGLLCRRRRGALAALAFFLISLFPVLGFFNIYYFRYSFVADHFQYLAEMGIIALVVGAATWLLTGALSRRAGNAAGRLLGVVCLAALAVLNIRHQPAYASTEALYRHTVAADPATCMPGANLGALLAARGEVGPAEDQYKLTIAHNPGCDEAHNNYGDLLAALGRLDEAAVQFQKALEINPLLAEAHNNLGTVYQDLGRSADAEACYRRALELKPRYDQAHNNLAAVLAAAGQTDDALEHFRQAVAINPRYIKARLRLANLLSQLNRPDEAIEQYEQVLALEPNNAIAHTKLAFCLIQQQRLDDAVRHGEQAVELQPNSAEAHNNLGIALAGLDQPADAAAHFAEAVRLKPDYAQARRNLEVVNAAMEKARAAAATQPTPPPPTTPTTLPSDASEAQRAEAVRLAKEGRLAEAVGPAQEAVRLNPLSAEAHDTLGILLFQMGKPEEALTALQEAIRLQPGLPTPHANLGVALMYLGRTDEALPEIAESVRLTPDDADVHYRYASALAAAGRSAEAVAQYREALRLKPGWRDALGPLARLLATAADPAVRSGAEAVRLAEELCQASEHPSAGDLDTLAAAYAEVGRFADAAAAIRQALASVDAANQPQAAADLQKHLDLYTVGQALRE